MNRKTLDIITLLIAALGACVALINIATPGNETIGVYLMSGAVVAVLMTILIPTRNAGKKGDVK